MTETTSSPPFILKPSEAGNVLLRSLQRFYAEKKLFDVSISCNSRTLFGCHKLVLASSSSYFETLLSDTDGFAILNLDAVDADYVKHLNTIVDFMYGHNILVPKTGLICEQLYEAARIFGATALIKTLDVQLSAKSGTSSSFLKTKRKPAAKLPSSICDGGDRPTISDTDDQTEQDELMLLKPCGIGSMLLVNFQRFKLDAKFIDAKICCRDQVLFTCHKLALASFSAYFETLLSSTEGSAILNLDAVDELYVKQLSTIIDYMYGKVTWVKAENVDLLRDAAHVFGVQSLEGGDLERMRRRNEKTKTRQTLTAKLEKLRNEGGTSARNAAVSNRGGHLSSTSANHSVRAESRNEPIDSAEPVTPLSSLGAVEEIISQGQWPVETEQLTIFASSKNRLVSGSSSTIGSNDEVAIDDVPEEDLSASYKLCLQCGKTFKRNSNALRAHLLKHQVVAKSTAVDSDFDSDSNPKKNRLSKISNLKCAWCPDVFENILELRTHWESTHGTPQEKRGCFQCDLVFANKSALINHQSIAHSSAATATTTIWQKKKNAAAAAKNGKQQLVCKACGYASTSLSIFAAHVESKHPANESICDLCDRSFADRQSLNRHYHEEHDIPMYMCPTCDKKFKTQSGYVNHIETHGGSQICPLCSFVTSTKKNLEIHTKKYHPIEYDAWRSEKKSAKIDKVGSTICAKLESPTSDAMESISTIPTILSISSKSTVSSIPLDSAMSTSNADSDSTHLRHKCLECSATFLYECLLTRHVHRKHLRMKPYKCPYCGHETTEKGALQTHIRCVHTDESPFVCDVCNFKCKTNSILNRHRRLHTGEKPYVCEHCGTAFVEKKNLTAHCWKVHLKLHPFKCSICQVGFFRKDNLLQHTRAKHGQNA